MSMMMMMMLLCYCSTADCSTNVFTRVYCYLNANTREDIATYTYFTHVPFSCGMFYFTFYTSHSVNKLTLRAHYNQI